MYLSVVKQEECYDISTFNYVSVETAIKHIWSSDNYLWRVLPPLSSASCSLQWLCDTSTVYDRGSPGVSCLGEPCLVLRPLAHTPLHRLHPPPSSVLPSLPAKQITFHLLSTFPSSSSISTSSLSATRTEPYTKHEVSIYSLNLRVAS